jgi:hypothetical protein
MDKITIDDMLQNPGRRGLPLLALLVACLLVAAALGQEPADTEIVGYHKWRY